MNKLGCGDLEQLILNECMQALQNSAKMTDVSNPVSRLLQY